MAKGKKIITIKQLAKMEITPCSASDLARMTALLEPARWEERQRGLHAQLALAFGFLGQTKERLVEAAESPELADALKHFVKDCRSDIEWLRAAIDFIESAEARIMVGMATAHRQRLKAA